MSNEPRPDLELKDTEITESAVKNCFDRNQLLEWKTEVDYHLGSVKASKRSAELDNSNKKFRKEYYAMCLKKSRLGILSQIIQNQLTRIKNEGPAKRQ